MKKFFFLLLIIPILGHTQSKTNNNTSTSLFNDSHFHLTNYIQEGIPISQLLSYMSTKVDRSTLFGIPLQQAWSYQNSGAYAPSYYLQTDAPLYYYSFTDAIIAQAYLKLSPKDQQRFDPMITGFNPADMYGYKHIERVLRMYPGVFTGIGEFTIHKEFVSSKVAGEVASLTNPALDSILEFAARVGLVVILHNDMDIPMANTKQEPAYLDQMIKLLKRHPNTTIIWAHMGLGRIVHPVNFNGDGTVERSSNHIDVVKSILDDPALSHVYFDISWDEVAKYIIKSDESIALTSKLFNKYPNRFLFGTDLVAPESSEKYLSVYNQYQPLWNALTPSTKNQIAKENYIRIFDSARVRVRAWEKQQK